MATIELESLAGGKTVDAVTLRIYGGQDHTERVTLADRYLDAMREFNPPIVCNAYECTTKRDGKGNSYVEFRFFTFNSNN